MWRRCLRATRPLMKKGKGVGGVTLLGSVTPETFRKRLSTSNCDGKRDGP